MRRKQPGRKGFDLDYKKISEEYLNNISLKNLANKYNISQWTLLARFKKLGIRKTTKRSLDENSFSQFNRESCYWAGFLAADGWINDKYYLSSELSIIDKNHLEKLKLFLQSNADIKEREKVCFNKLHNYCSVQFNSVNLVNNLKENFNLTNNKSLTLAPPDKIPQNLIRHFIRGYIDGDGSIGWCKYNNKPRLIICSGSKLLLEWMQNSIRNNIETGNPKISQRKNANTYVLEYKGKQVFSILEWIYYDSTTYLDRKYSLYMEYKSYVSAKW